MRSKLSDVDFSQQNLKCRCSYRAHVSITDSLRTTMFTGHPSTRASYICARCVRQSRRRLYSSQTSNAPPPPPPPPSGAAKLTNRRLISLHGQDAAKFLQGLVSGNIRPDSRSGLYTAFLNAQGRVLSDAFIYPTLGSEWHRNINQDEEQGYLVEVDSEQAAGLVKQFKKHKLRSKFKLRLLEEGELDTWSIWKEDERWTAHTKAEDGGGLITLTDSRAPGMGSRLLLPPSNATNSLARYQDVSEAPLSAYTTRRYLRGVPEGQVETPADDSLPMNCNIDLMGGIDFKKGCYVGQELTIRTHHTGVVRRRILPIALYPHGQEPPETLQYDPSTSISALENGVDVRRDDRRKRTTGKFVASVGNIGLAMCRLEQMSDLKVSGEASSFSPEDKFIVQNAAGELTGLKAFVPDWVRGQIREPKIQKRVE